MSTKRYLWYGVNFGTLFCGGSGSLERVNSRRSQAFGAVGTLRDVKSTMKRSAMPHQADLLRHFRSEGYGLTRAKKAQVL